MDHHNPILDGGGFHHVAIAARDFDRSVSFYTDVLGCRATLGWGEPPKRAVMLDTGGGNYIELFERPTHDRGVKETSLLHLALRCSDIDGVLDRVRNAGMKIHMEPKSTTLQNTVQGGPAEAEIRIAFFYGPDEEVVELFATTNT